MGEAGLQTSLGELDEAVSRRLAGLGEADVVGRIWAGDHTVWREDPTEITDRLGWLQAPERARREAAGLRAFAEEVAAEGLTHAVLMGMGGSSLAPEVFRDTFGAAPGMLDLAVLDTTHPGAVARLERTLDFDRTLFVVSSKSGTTVETRSHMAYFYDQVKDGSRFAAVTDPGTPLEEAARDLGFRRVFAAPPDVGGRYSALTPFGLLPAALVGVDLEAVIARAADAAGDCGPGVPPDRNPAALLGAVLGEAAQAGRDKATLATAPGVAAFGAWVEQLLAESTGKEGTGILPVDGEPPGPPEVYGQDRLFVGVGAERALEPRVAVPFREPADLGWLYLTFELATAVAGHVLGVHPFDQPDVQAAKDRTSEVLAAGEIREEPPGDLDALLGTVTGGDYVAIQAFVDPTPEAGRDLRAAQGRIRDRLGVAATTGFGPSYLHSTGQFHKGGPGTGVFVQVFQEPEEEDRAVPGADFTFGRLIAAQAAGDLAALRARGRRVARVALDDLRSWGA